MRIRVLLTLAVALLALGAANPGSAVTPDARSGDARLGIPAVTLTEVASELQDPLEIASPPGSTDLYVAEKCGVIKVVTGGATRRVGSLATRVRCDAERGLLSLAFDPDFQSNHRLYVYFTRTHTGDIQVARLKVARKHLVSGSYHEILRIRHRQAANHNGGKLVFDGAGLLYISVGDGGGGGNQFGHAQDHQSLLGKILRIDVHRGSPYAIPAGNPLGGSRGRPEIWAIGARNPWRMSFDPDTDSLWIGDVGQDVVEEIDRVRAGSGKLRNLGWSHYEGRRVYDSGERLRGGRLVMPVHTYRHPTGSSVIGGAVYRGSLSPALAGFYVYGDLSGWIAGFDVTDTASSFTFDTGVSLLTISQAADGELYAGFADGTVQHIVVAAG